MTHEQRIAEIRECLRIPFPSDKEKYPGHIAFLLKQLDEKAAECLRLREKTKTKVDYCDEDDAC